VSGTLLIKLRWSSLRERSLSLPESSPATRLTVLKNSNPSNTSLAWQVDDFVDSSCVSKFSVTPQFCHMPSLLSTQDLYHTRTAISSIICVQDLNCVSHLLIFIQTPIPLCHFYFISFHFISFHFIYLLFTLI